MKCQVRFWNPHVARPTSVDSPWIFAGVIDGDLTDEAGDGIVLRTQAGDFTLAQAKRIFVNQEDAIQELLDKAKEADCEVYARQPDGQEPKLVGHTFPSLRR